MKIYDETKTKILQEKNCDIKKGTLNPDKLIVGRRESLKEVIKDGNGNIIETVYPTLDIEEDILVYVPYSQKKLYIMEQNDLRDWFANEYGELYQKCKRRIDMGKMMRDGTDPREKLKEIYEKAEKVADRINELEVLIKGEENDFNNN